MNIEEYIKMNVSKLGFRILIAPDIDKKNLNECLKYIVNDIDEEYILAFGNANFHHGFVFTGEKLYFSNDKNKEVVLFSDLSFAEYDKKNNNDDNEYRLGDQITLVLKNRKIMYLRECMLGFNCKIMETLLNGIVELVSQGAEIKSTKQNTSLDRIPEEAKLLYLKVLCNYAYINDNVIDSDEYAAIQRVIVRINAHPDVRLNIREYMTNIENKEKTGNILYKLKNGVDYGTFDIIRYSLMQDVLYLFYITYNHKDWTNDGFVGGMLNTLRLLPEQIDLMINAVELHQKMIVEDSDVSQLKKEIDHMKDMSKILRIPLMTLYCSGSVYSVDSYNKIFGGKKKANLAIEKQRELILQTVIKNTQKTVNNLVEDTNLITQRLIEEINKGELSKEKINQLTLVLSKITKSARKTVINSEIIQKKELYLQLPKVIDINKLEAIKNEGNFTIQCNYILKYYLKDNQNQYTLQEDLSIIELNRIKESLQEISYS